MLELQGGSSPAERLLTLQTKKKLHWLPTEMPGQLKSWKARQLKLSEINSPFMSLSISDLVIPIQS